MHCKANDKEEIAVEEKPTEDIKEDIKEEIKEDVKEETKEENTTKKTKPTTKRSKEEAMRINTCRGKYENKFDEICKNYLKCEQCWEDYDEE